MSRPKCSGMIRAARATPDDSARSGFASTGHGTILNVIEARNASRRRIDAEESSRSCTTIGRSLTVSEIAVPIKSSRKAGSTSARISAMRSRTIWVSSLRACARMRRIRRLPAARVLARPLMKTSSSENGISRASSTATPLLCSVASSTASRPRRRRR